MDKSTLKLKNGFIGKMYYEKLGVAPRRIDGEAGQFQRHIVSNERHGVFHVITPALSHVFKSDDLVEIDGEALFFEDRALNGSDVAPALNARATGVKLVSGGIK